MDQQKTTIILFAIGQLATFGLAIAGWVIASKLMIKQLSRQHAYSLQVDEARFRRETSVRTVQDLLRHLYQLGDSGAKVAGVIGSMGILLPKLPGNPGHREAFITYLLPEFNRAWDAIQAVGFEFVNAFDCHEPIVHTLIPERDALCLTLFKIQACRIGSAHRFFDVVSGWIVDSENSSDFALVEKVHELCRAEFEPLREALDASVTTLRTKLQNEFLAPLFDHQVNPYREVRLPKAPVKSDEE
jgi:hypothetical protein